MKSEKLKKIRGTSYTDITAFLESRGHEFTINRVYVDEPELQIVKAELELESYEVFKVLYNALMPIMGLLNDDTETRMWEMTYYVEYETTNDLPVAEVIPGESDELVFKKGTKVHEATTVSIDAILMPEEFQMGSVH
ncbi:hypothetical protein ACFL1B_00600 [Nanoarchaeota archaeon]